jgi:hypothetical protein
VTRKSSKPPRHTTAGDALPPTPERLQHGVVERLPRPIADDYGRPARPYRSIDILAAMERRGTITAAMFDAGDDFRTQFNKAHLDALHAAAFERLGHSLSDAPGLNTTAARERIWRAVKAVGGHASPAGSCLWHVLGLEQSLKRWALEYGAQKRRVDQEQASGILIAALGMLEAHFNGRAGSIA